MKRLVLANVRNGLPLVPDPDGLTYFLSTHAHHSNGYFREGAMPLNAVVHLLRGGVVEVVDASARRPLPDALVTGVGTWALVFGRATRLHSNVPWATPAMLRACWLKRHEATVKTIRRLMTVYGTPNTALDIVSTVDYRWGGKQITAREIPAIGPALVVSAPVRATWDDRPERIAELVA